MTLKAGRLRHRIEIQERQDAQDPITGEMVPNWTTLWSSVPAAIEPLSVREFMASKAIQSDISTRITIRFRDGLNASMRVLHNGKIYNPAGWLPDPVRGNEYLTAPCSEGVNEG